MFTTFAIEASLRTAAPVEVPEVIAGPEGRPSVKPKTGACEEERRGTNRKQLTSAPALGRAWLLQSGRSGEPQAKPNIARGR
ncbi:MAG: hypothetical protein ACREIR_23375 [Geminicoccaceae bacterium]